MRCLSSILFTSCGTALGELLGSIQIRKTSSNKDEQTDFVLRLDTRTSSSEREVEEAIENYFSARCCELPASRMAPIDVFLDASNALQITVHEFLSLSHSGYRSLSSLSSLATGTTAE